MTPPRTATQALIRARRENARRPSSRPVSVGVAEAVPLTGTVQDQAVQVPQPEVLEAARDRLGDLLGDRLQTLDRLQPALRLHRLRCLVAEAVDEGLHVVALLFLLPFHFQGQRLLLAALALEVVVVAHVNGELALIEMQD